MRILNILSAAHLRFIFFTLLIFQCSFGSAQNIELNTIWEGKISGIRLIIKINKDEVTNSPKGTLDSPDQGVLDHPFTQLDIIDDSIVAISSQIGGGFKGKLNAEKTALIGNWSQAGRSFPIEFVRVSEVKKIERPQTPVGPFPYNEQKIIYHNADKSIQYGATLTLPTDAKSVAAVILISGSGQQDRDETLFGHKPFWVIADYLTRNGIAVLRVDDRGIGETTGDLSNATSLNFAEDVLVGVNYLKTVKEINPKKIGLIGHSEGGMIAPLAANKSTDVAFIVSLAGLGINGGELLLKQVEDAVKASGIANADEVAKLVEFRRNMIDLSAKHPSKEQLEVAFQNMSREWKEKQSPDFLAKFEFSGPKASDNLQSMSAAMYSPWMRYFIAYDPKAVLSKIKIPVLAINGEKDVQVRAKENLDGFKMYLTAAGNKKFEIVSYPNLNHLFQTANTGDVSEYGQIEETFNVEVLKKMSSWIKEVTK